MKMHLVLILSLVFVFMSKTVGSEIVIKGSDTLGAKLIPMLTERYRAKNPDIKFSITAEGTESGFQSLFSKECDIGMASRPLTDDERLHFAEKNIALNARIIGYSMTAIIVHKENPVTNLTVQDLEKIFTGEVIDWREFGAEGTIVAYHKNSSTEMYKSFQQMAMRGRPYGTTVQALYGGPPHRVFEEPENRRRAITYVGLPFASGSALKLLSVNGITPTNPYATKYPLTRKLLLYTRSDLPKEVHAFMDWICSSEEAFAITENVGFASIRTNVAPSASALPHD